jgi:hypothetical protein
MHPKLHMCTSKGKGPQLSIRLDGHDWNEDTIHGRQTGSKIPILRLNQDILVVSVEGQHSSCHVPSHTKRRRWLSTGRPSSSSATAPAPEHHTSAHMLDSSTPFSTPCHPCKSKAQRASILHVKAHRSLAACRTTCLPRAPASNPSTLQVGAARPQAHSSLKQSVSKMVCI